MASASAMFFILFPGGMSECYRDGGDHSEQVATEWSVTFRVEALQAFAFHKVANQAR